MTLQYGWSTIFKEAAIYIPSGINRGYAPENGPIVGEAGMRFSIG